MDSIDEEHKEMIFVYIFFFQMSHLQYFFREELFESECKRNLFLGSLLSLEGLFDIEFIGIFSFFNFQNNYFSFI